MCRIVETAVSNVEWDDDIHAESMHKDLMCHIRQ